MRKWAAVFILGLTVAVALVLVVDRGGLIAWSVFLLGIAMLVKIRLRPSALDLGLGIGLAVVSVAVWIGTLYHVISTWETGEVVELAVDTESGTHTARVWVLDIGADPLVYYDAPPELAKSLLAGTPVRFTRAGQVSTRIPRATRVDALPEDEANRIFEAMGAKYGDRMDAAGVFYTMLGRSRDRIAVVADLIEE